ncbi:MAG: ribonuclease P protein component [Phycisphaerales bacterium]
MVEPQPNSHEAAPQDSPRRLHFRRAQRLTHAREFDAVFDASVRKPAGPLTVFGISNGTAVTRLGLSIGRRVGGAVVRNRIKRLLREAFRILQHDMPKGLDLIITVRPHAPLRLAAYRELLLDAVRRVDTELQRRTRRREP